MTLKWAEDTEKSDSDHAAIWRNWRVVGPQHLFCPGLGAQGELCPHVWTKRHCMKEVMDSGTWWACVSHVQTTHRDNPKKNYSLFKAKTAMTPLVWLNALQSLMVLNNTNLSSWNTSKEPAYWVLNLQKLHCIEVSIFSYLIRELRLADFLPFQILHLSGREGLASHPQRTFAKGVQHRDTWRPTM